MSKLNKMKMLDLMKYSHIAVPVLSTALDAFNVKYPEGSELNVPFSVEGIKDVFLVRITSTGIVLTQQYNESEYYGLKLNTFPGEKSPLDFWVPHNIESWKTNINIKNEHDFPVLENTDSKLDVFYYYSTDKFPEEIYLNSEMHEDVESFFFQLSLVHNIIPVQEFRDEVNLAKEISDMLPEFSVLFCDSGYYSAEVYIKFISCIKELNI